MPLGLGAVRSGCQTAGCMVAYHLYRVSSVVKHPVEERPLLTYHFLDNLEFKLKGKGVVSEDQNIALLHYSRIQSKNNFYNRIFSRAAVKSNNQE